MENEVQTKEKSLAFWVVLLAMLVAGVVGLFALLEVVAPDSWEAQIWDEMTVEKGQSGTYQIRMLQDEERQEKDIRAWLESAKEWTDGENATAEHSAFWLYRQGSDDYILYLPQQDRVLGLADLTVSEESNENGEVTLVIRARTPEDGEEIVPEEQLFAIQTTSETWRGIRMSVILDGREKNVYKLVSKGGKLYSTEEVYIGRF